jgi:hypothetical protein
MSQEQQLEQQLLYVQQQLEKGITPSEIAKQLKVSEEIVNDMIAIIQEQSEGKQGQFKSFASGGVTADVSREKDKSAALKGTSAGLGAAAATVGAVSAANIWNPIGWVGSLVAVGLGVGAAVTSSQAAKSDNKAASLQQRDLQQQENDASAASNSSRIREQEAELNSQGSTSLYGTSAYKSGGVKSQGATHITDTANVVDLNSVFGRDAAVIGVKRTAITNGDTVRSKYIYESGRYGDSTGSITTYNLLGSGDKFGPYTSSPITLPHKLVMKGDTNSPYAKHYIKAFGPALDSNKRYSKGGVATQGGTITPVSSRTPALGRVHANKPGVDNVLVKANDPFWVNNGELVARLPGRYVITPKS